MPFNIVDIDGGTQAPGSAVPVRGLHILGSDGTNSRFLLTDASGRLTIIGQGTAGTPAGGVVSVQGVVGGIAQPVSVASLPLPAGAATEATLASIKAKTDNLDVALSTRAVTGLTDAQLRASAVPVSAAALPLPTGAATEATLATRAADATLTGGTQKAIVRGGAKGATTAADVTGTAEGADHQALDVQIYHGSAAINPTAIRALTSADVVTAAQGTAAAVAGSWPVKITDGTNTMPVGDVVARSAFTQIADGTTGPVAVMPASTAPSVTDNSLVVVLSPNQAAIAVTSSPANTTPNLAFGDILLAAITTAAIRRTAYTEQTTNFVGSIVSSNANDTAAGTGARTARITYVNSTGATAGTETVTLNGTTAVNLVTATKCFIEKMEVLTVGSTGSNVGIITLKTGSAGAGTTVGTIAATDNRTFWAHHYVVSGKTCNVTSILAGSNVTNTVGSSTTFIKALPIGVANAVELQVSDFIIVAGLDSAVIRNYGSLIQVAGPARLTLYVTTATSSSFTYRGSFDSYE